MVKAAKVSIMYVPLFIKQIKKAETCLALFNKKKKLLLLFFYSVIFFIKAHWGIQLVYGQQ